MNKEILRMQKLAGIITESQYRSQLSELASPPMKWMDIAKPYFDEGATLEVALTPEIAFRPKEDIGADKGPEVSYKFGVMDKKNKKVLEFFPYANAKDKVFGIRPSNIDKDKAVELAKKLAPAIISAVSDALLKDPKNYTSGGYEDKATPEQAKQAIEFFTAALKGEPKEV